MSRFANHHPGWGQQRVWEVVSERLAQIEADPASRVPLPAAGKRQSSRGPAFQALIHAGNGLTWDQVRIEVSHSKMIRQKAPGQEREFHFPPNVQVTADHALGMLMRLAADGEWRNPPLGSAEYERVSRAFRRLRQLLQALVPLPGDPFKKHSGAFIPVFQVNRHAENPLPSVPSAQSAVKPIQMKEFQPLITRMNADFFVKKPIST